jgi:hypothetical protein
MIRRSPAEPSSRGRNRCLNPETVARVRIPFVVHPDVTTNRAWTVGGVIRASPACRPAPRPAPGCRRELVEDGDDVEHDRAFGDGERFGDLLVGLPGGDEAPEDVVINVAANASGFIRGLQPSSESWQVLQQQSTGNEHRLQVAICARAWPSKPGVTGSSPVGRALCLQLFTGPFLGRATRTM